MLLLSRKILTADTLLLDIFSSFVEEKYLDAMKGPSVSSLMTGLVYFNI